MTITSLQAVRWVSLGRTVLRLVDVGMEPTVTTFLDSAHVELVSWGNTVIKVGYKILLPILFAFLFYVFFLIILSFSLSFVSFLFLFYFKILSYLSSF